MTAWSLPISQLIVQTYDGDVTNDGVFSGTGTAVYHAGHRYNGQFTNGMLKGLGTYIWSDGVRYEGQFHDNEITGSGTYTWNDGYTYQGEVKQALRNGVGKFEYLGGDCFYSGEWSEGKPNGQGLLQYDKVSFYKGGWKDGQRNGKGTMCYRSRNLYDGEWQNGIKHGIGKMVWSNRGEEYSGEWKDGKPTGTGIYLWKIQTGRPHQYPMYNRYEGKWLDGKRHGYGVFQYSSGATYQGEWVQNKKHGKGKYISEYGRQYIGEFQNDRPVGNFERFSNNLPYLFLATSENLEHASTSGAVIKEIHDIINRHYDLLCQTYTHYSKPAIDLDNPKHVLTRESMWQLFSDIGIVQQGITFADLNRAFAKEFYNHPFLESAIRIRITRMSNLFYTTFTSGYCFKQSTPTKYELFMRLIHEHFQDNYSREVEQLYIQWAKTHSKALPKSKKDKTLSIRELILVLKDYNILATLAAQITISFVIQHFSKSIPNVADSSSYNLEFELMHVEVFELIYAAGLNGCVDVSAEMNKLFQLSTSDSIDVEMHFNLAIKSISGSQSTISVANNKNGLLADTLGLAGGSLQSIYLPTPIVSADTAPSQLITNPENVCADKLEFPGESECTFAACAETIPSNVIMCSTQTKTSGEKHSVVAAGITVDSASSQDLATQQLKQMSLLPSQTINVTDGPSTDDIRPSDEAQKETHLQKFYKATKDIHDSIQLMFTAIIKEHAAHIQKMELISRSYVREMQIKAATKTAEIVQARNRVFEPGESAVSTTPAILISVSPYSD
ncbi:hypothetical protein BDV3_006324 [Batrachochytrium dendrobatidis]